MRIKAKSGVITNAKQVEGSLGRPANRRPFKTLIRGYGFLEIESITWGRTCAGTDVRGSEISYNR